MITKKSEPYSWQRGSRKLLLYLFIALLLAVVSFCCCSFLLLSPVAMVKTECSNSSKITGLETRWMLVSGCFIKTEGGWIPRDAWNGVQFLNE